MPRVNSYTIEKKLSVIKYHKENGTNLCRTSKHFGIDRKRIREWLQKEQTLIANNYGSKKLTRKLTSGRAVLSEEVDNGLYDFYQKKKQDGLAVSIQMLSCEALKLAQQLGIQDFKASDMYIHRWKKRFNIQIRSRTADSQKIPCAYTDPISVPPMKCMELTSRHDVLSEEVDFFHKGRTGELAMSNQMLSYEAQVAQQLEIQDCGTNDSQKIPSDYGDAISVPPIKNSKDDPLVEIPGLTGTELQRKSQITGMDIRSMVVRCTICRSQINHLDSHKVKRHRQLNVVICRECHDFYGTEEFSRDESGNYNYCAWCGNGGKLFLCDFCPNVFCMKCVKANFGRAEVAEMSKEGWKCYICAPNKLKAKVAYCDLILYYSKSKKQKKPEPELKELISEAWVIEAFTKTESACKSLQLKIDRLKNIEVSRTKSLKHIIAKMEEIVSKHKAELGNVMKTLSSQYISYVKLKQGEEKLHTENSNQSNGSLSAVNNSQNQPTVICIQSDSDDNFQEAEKNEADSKEEHISLNSSKENLSSLSEPKVDCKDKLKSFNSSKNKLSSETELNADDEDRLKIVNSDGLCNNSVTITELKESVHNGISDNEENLEELKCNNSEKEISEEMKAKMDLLRDSSDESNVDCKVSDSDNCLKSKETKSGSVSKKCNITVTAEVHSSELSEDIFRKEKPKAHPKTVSKTINKSECIVTAKNCAIKESSVSSLSSDSSASIPSLGIPGSSKKSKVSRKRSQQNPSNEKAAAIDYVNDLKLRLPTRVILERCDDITNGRTTIKVPAIYRLDEIDRTIRNLVKEPGKKKKIDKSTTQEKKKTMKVGPKKVRKDSSSSITFSSEDEEEDPIGEAKFVTAKDDLEEIAKKELLASSDSGSVTSSSDSDIVKDKKSKKKSATSKKNSGSSDDFQPKKKRKFDKLLNKRITSDNESSKEHKKGFSERQKKRKNVLSEDGDGKKTSISDSTSTSGSDDEGKKPKSKKRKRIKKPALSSSEKSENAEDKDKGETPKKGRKEIKKIISKKDLKEETKEAQQAERERKRRIEEKQKLYNVITDTSKDGKEIITKKLVLEIDPDSKEEIIQIHPDIIEKLKPHQVNGIKFMWECTIESIKDLEKSPGSGCILAHCMGLGKTLQVITFLHTCLTNKAVNKKIKNAMVICPYNTVLNWSKEVEMWLTDVDTESILLHEMTIAKDNYMRLDILKYWHTEGGILIISYDIFRRLAGNKIPKLKKNQKDKVHEYLLDPGPDIVVCDEGHILKNESSAISKACAQLKTQRRIVLTGTPLQNNLQEYHCMLSFVKPHLLGTSKEFRNRFVNPIINGQYEDSNEYDVRRMKKRIHILHKLLDGCVQRCDYSALTKFLPTKHEYVISVKLSDVQIKMYQWYLDNMSKAKGQDKIQGGTLFQDYNILRNVCTHPYLIHTSFERAEKRKILKDERDGKDETDYESSFVTDGSSSPSTKTNNSGSDTDEIIKEYKTRSRRKSVSEHEDSEGSVTEVQEVKKEWYHQFISDEDAHKIEVSGKIVLLLNILKECELIGDKVIVFSQSLLTLDIIEKILSHVDDNPDSGFNTSIGSSWIAGLDYFRMDGGTSADFRKKFIEMFNNPINDRARLFLVSTKAGGLGTNLVGANRVVMFDASWNPSHDVQAIFRVYRFGQKKPVYIYRLLAQGTMEEKIYDRQVTKLSLSIRVVDEQQIDRHFNAAELSELYTFEPESQSNRPTPMVPNDRLLAEMLIKYKDLIVNYHEHDSLLQNETEEDLTEEDRKSAWNEYENEREGKTADEILVDEEIRKYCKEPDFNEADYDGAVISSAKSIVESLISSVKEKYIGQSASDMRKKLLHWIYLTRNLFQEQHVKCLRMKQEYLARGSVPAVVNKYLEELNTVLNELGIHYTNVSQLIMTDNQKQAQELAAKYKASQRPPQSHVPPTGYTYRPQVRYTIIRNGVPSMNNYQPYMRNMRPTFTTGVPNPSGTFPSAGIPRAYARNFQYPTQTTTSQTARPPATSQPVITEAPMEDSPENLTQQSNSKSSVTIEEIE